MQLRAVNTNSVGLGRSVNAGHASQPNTPQHAATTASVSNAPITPISPAHSLVDSITITRHQRAQNPFAQNFGLSSGTLIGASRGLSEHIKDLQPPDTSAIFTEKFLKWGLRDGMGRALNTAVHKQGEIASTLSKNSYEQILGIFEPSNSKAALPKITFGDIGNGYLNKATSNIHTIKANSVKLPKLSTFLKETVIKGNIDPVRHTFKGGGSGIQKINFGGVAQGMGLGLVGYDILKNTKKAYSQSRQDGDHALETGLKTAGTFVSKTIKNTLSWELAGVVFKIANRVVPLPVAMAAGAFAATVFTEQANKVISDP